MSLKKRGLRVMKPSVSRSGYSQVNFYPFGEVKHHYVHRLVALAFLGPIPDGVEVHHADEDKKNDNISNLEIVTAEQNIRHAISLGLIPPMRGEQSPRAKLRDEQVRAIKRLKGTLRVKEVAERLGVSARTVYFVWEGKTWRHVA